MRKDLAIADAGCGNGIWAIEVAEQYPTAEVAAIDVSNFQFPPQWTIPDNCSFHRLDLMQPIGEEYAHSFDLINVRLLAGPLDATDCTPIVHNLCRMLKPNGWIQWLDILSPGIRAYDAENTSEESRTWKAIPPITTRFPAFVKSTRWLARLPDILKLHGLIDVETHDCPPKRAILKHETDDIELVLMDLAQSRPDVESDVVENFKDAVDELAKEVLSGRMFTVVLQTVIGKKKSRDFWISDPLA